MTSYLACMKKVKGMNDPSCRELAKSYLSCRMERCVWIPIGTRSWQDEGLGVWG